MNDVAQYLQDRLSALFEGGCTMAVFDHREAVEELVPDTLLAIEEHPEGETVVIRFRSWGMWREAEGWNWNRARHFTVDVLSQLEERDGVPAGERMGYPHHLPEQPEGGLRLFGTRYYALLTPGVPEGVDWQAWRARRDEVLADDELRQAWMEGE